MGCSCGSFIHGLPFGGCFVSTGTGAVTDDVDADGDVARKTVTLFSETLIGADEDVFLLAFAALAFIEASA
jgi:hypothetical protein